MSEPAVLYHRRAPMVWLGFVAIAGGASWAHLVDEYLYELPVDPNPTIITLLAIVAIVWGAAGAGIGWFGGVGR